MCSIWLQVTIKSVQTSNKSKNIVLNCMGLSLEQWTITKNKEKKFSSPWKHIAQRYVEDKLHH